MLLEHVLLMAAGPPSGAAAEHARRVWLIRERTEHEVSAIFARLAPELRAIGLPAVVCDLAEQAGRDELVHAAHCRRVVEALGGAAPLMLDLAIQLGARGQTREEAALHTSVALGCVTETLSAALLIELRKRSGVPEVHDAFDVILKDEVQHSRLGWAHLAWAAQRGDVSFLEPHVQPMIAAALDAERTPAAPEDEAALTRWGVLPARDVAAIAEATIASTILPGLARFGVDARR